MRFVKYISLSIIFGFSIIELTASAWPTAPGKWKISENDTTCMIVSGYFVFHIPYTNILGQIVEAKISIPPDAQGSGNCTEWEQEIILKWSPPGTNSNLTDTTFYDSVIFTFTQNGSRGSGVLDAFFQLARIKAIIHSNPIEFPLSADENAVYEISKSELTYWAAPLEYSYFCESSQNVPLDDKVQSAYLEANSIQVEPFHIRLIPQDLYEFSSSSFCSEDVTTFMLNGILFIGLLVLISIGIMIFISKWTRRQYEIV